MITITEFMRKQQWLCVFYLALHVGLATGTCPENEYAAQQAQWPRVSFSAYENEFSSGGSLDNYVFSLWNGVSAKLISGWTHTASYAHGFLRSGAGDSVLEVNGLVPGKEYLYATYNFHDPTHSTYAYSWGLNSFTLYVNGVQVASLSGQPTSSEPTYTGQVTADSSGKIFFKFTHTNEHLHLSGLSVEAVCQSCPPSMTSLPGSTSVSNCTSTCASGTYHFTIPEIEWQFRGGNSWGSLQQHEFVQAGIALGYQSRYLTKEEMTAWMSANGNSLPSTWQSWVWVSPGQSKTYGFWSMWTNTFHPYAPYEHDGTFGGSLDMADGYFFRKNQPETLCKTCSTGQVTANDGAISVDACICAVNSYATADEDMLTYTDSNFYVSSNQGLDQNTVYYETTQNGFALEFHHWDEKTPWANGFVLFSYDGVYNTKTNNLAEVRITSLVPGAEYKINLFHYLQNGWQNVYWHEGEFMFSVNGGSLQRFDTVEMPSPGVPPPTTVLTVAAKDDGTISLLFTRDMQKDAGGRFTADCAVFNPPLRNCNAAGRHLVLSGLSIAPVCASCPGELTSPPGSSSKYDCGCPVGFFFGKTITSYAEDNFKQGNANDVFSDTVLLSNGFTVELSGWTHTRDYANGYLDNTYQGEATATVVSLTPGKSYEYAIGVWNTVAEYEGYFWVSVNGGTAIQLYQTQTLQNYTGTATAKGDGTIEFKFNNPDNLPMFSVASLRIGTDECVQCPTDGTVVEGCQPPCVDGTSFSYWSIRKSVCP